MTKFGYNLRGILGKDLRAKHIKKFSKNIINYIYENDYSKAVILGKDNRESSDYIASLIQTELLASGIKIFVIGETTTPQLIFLTRKFKFKIGIMVTASHNSSEFNGIKCFNQNGDMLDIDYNIYKKIKHAKYEKVIDISRYKELYLRKIKNELNPNKTKCIFDCANGVMVDVVKNIFPMHKIIGNDTSGKYINYDCGTEHLDKLKMLCKANGQIGFAFDGDGDRVIAIDKNGNTIDGDKILYILAKEYLGDGDKVVGTITTSLALQRALEKLNIKLIREKVGAKYVSRRMIKEKSLLGGESCGHIFTPKSNASDGVLVVIELLNILNRTGLEFDELLKEYPKTYKITNDLDIETISNTTEYQQSTNDMRIVIRQSTTEDKLRVLVEGFDESMVAIKYQQIIEKICNRGDWYENRQHT